MQTQVHGSPSFAYIQVSLEPGESIVAEADAMSSMDPAIDVEARLNGGFFSALCKSFLGKESLFVNHFTNNTSEPRQLTLVQKTPGDIRQVDLGGRGICLQPGAYIASSPGLRLRVKWAGLISGFIAREGFFKLEVEGNGTLWYGAYGGLVDKRVDGEYIVDTGHLVAYPPNMTLKAQLAGGLFASFFSGEGLVTRMEGRGRITIQTRSIRGFTDWLNPKLPLR